MSVAYISLVSSEDEEEPSRSEAANSTGNNAHVRESEVAEVRYEADFEDRGCWTEVRIVPQRNGKLATKCTVEMVHDEPIWRHFVKARNNQTVRELAATFGGYAAAPLLHANQHLETRSFNAKLHDNTLVFLPDVHIAEQGETFGEVASRFSISARELIEEQKSVNALRKPRGLLEKPVLDGVGTNDQVEPGTQLLLPEYRAPGGPRPELPGLFKTMARPNPPFLATLSVAHA